MTHSSHSSSHCAKWKTGYPFCHLNNIYGGTPEFVSHPVLSLRLWRNPFAVSFVCCAFSSFFHWPSTKRQVFLGEFFVSAIRRLDNFGIYFDFCKGRLRLPMPALKQMCIGWLAVQKKTAENRSNSTIVTSAPKKKQQKHTQKTGLAMATRRLCYPVHRAQHDSPFQFAFSVSTKITNFCCLLPVACYQCYEHNATDDV